MIRRGHTSRNRLNQYDPVVTATSPEIGQRLKYDPDGNLTEALTLGDVDGDGDVDQDDIDAVLFAYGTCEGNPGYDPGANVSTDSPCGTDPQLQTINQDDIDVILYLYGLEATNTLRAKLTSDAENRLTGWEPLAFVPGARKVQFGYDFQGRRVEKRVYVYDGSAWALHETRRFVYWGWLPLLELDCGTGVPPVCTVVKQYTWGLDLAQSLGAAGGIGGLLACRDPNDPADANDPYGDFAYFYDAGGNVTQLVGVSASAGYGQLAARYEYDPYGNPLLDVGSDSASGGYAPFNALRFSTKPFDDETTFGNWGRRIYGPTLGRWGSRDPIGERGGINLYSYVGNAPSVNLDAVGEHPVLLLAAAAYLYVSAEYANAPGPNDRDEYKGVEPQAVTNVLNATTVLGGVGLLRTGYLAILCGQELVGTVAVAYGADLGASGVVGTVTGEYVPTLLNNAVTRIAGPEAGFAADLAAGLGTGLVAARAARLGAASAAACECELVLIDQPPRQPLARSNPLFGLVPDSIAPPTSPLPVAPPQLARNAGVGDPIHDESMLEGGTIAGRHNANVTIRRAGVIVQQRRLVSGDMLPEEDCGFPQRIWSTCTEKRIKQLDLRPGDEISIIGQKAPCDSCQELLSELSREGMLFRYRWRDNGCTKLWTPRD